MRFKILIIIFLLNGGLSPLIQAQNKTDEKPGVDREIKGVAIAGFNLTQVDGDEVYGFNKFGTCVGFGGILPLGHRFSMSLEILYDEKGAFRKYPPSPVDSLQLPYYSLKWNYLTAPLMFHYEDRNTWTFGLGFSWGRMVSFKEKEWNIQKPWDRPDTITYKTKNDFSVIADLRFRIWKHLKFNIRYSYSLVPVRTRVYTNPVTFETWERKQYNNVITIRLLYYFNEKYLPDRFTFKKNRDKKKKTKTTE
ncbi:MAG TPA: outer membrane beta-barrel protein [Bacteroidales bacterium]|nr:outer membrane beta-barrel protein [Bacteroidales bacterium]